MGRATLQTQLIFSGRAEYLYLYDHKIRTWLIGCTCGYVGNPGSLCLRTGCQKTWDSLKGAESDNPGLAPLAGTTVQASLLVCRLFQFCQQLISLFYQKLLDLIGQADNQYFVFIFPTDISLIQ